MIRPGYLQLIATLMSDKQKHRVVRLPATTCDKAMEKEQLLLEQVKQGEEKAAEDPEQQKKSEKEGLEKP